MNESTFTGSAQTATDALWPSLHSPQWLWLLPVVLIAFGLLLLIARRGREHALGTFAAPRLLGTLLLSLSRTRRAFKSALILIGAALIVFAIARPQYGYRWSESRSRGIDVMFVLDTSHSMLATDIKPDRLQRAKLAILDFVDQLDGDRIGLVAFAGDAFVQCPLTLDYNAFEQSLEAINTDTIPVGGTDFSRAITVAEDAFAKDNNHKILIMLTDGEDLEAQGLKRAKEAAKNGVTIFAVGVGTEEGSLIPVTDRFGRRDFLRDDNGQQVTTRLESDTLNDIAEVTGGFYVPLGSAGEGLQTVYHAGLQSFEKQELSSQMKREGIDRFQWPLGLALILLAWEPLISNRRASARRAFNFFTRRRKNSEKDKAAPASAAKNGTASALTALLVPALLAASAFLPPEARAMTPRKAEALFNKGDHAAAQEAFTHLLQAEPGNARVRYNLANTQLAQKQYEQAAKTYAQVLADADIVLQADAFYNLGLAHYGRGAQAFEGSDPEQTQEESVQAREAAIQADQRGRQLLQQAAQIAALEQQRSASIPTDTQKPEIPQEAVQQAIQSAEQAKQASQSAYEAGEAFIEKAQVASGFWRRAEADFNSAAELSSGNLADARHNAGQTQKSIDALSARINQTQNANRTHEADVQSLEKLIEELKKLLKEPPQNDQNQDQQQQNQDQNQQQQDQNQGDSQDNKDNQQQQGGQGSQQEQKQDDQQEQNKDQSQSEGDQQQEQNQQSQDQQQTGENGQQNDRQQEQNQQEREQNQEQQPDNKGESPEQSPADKNENQDDRSQSDGEPQSSEAEQDEPKNGESGQQQQERPPAEQQNQQDDDRQQGASTEEQGAREQGEEQAVDLTDEQKEQMAAGEQPMQDQPPASQQEGGTRRAGAMSQQEAAGLLDSLNNSGKLLPLSGRGQHQPANRPRKNW